MWLAGRKSRHTRKAYARDIADYLAWCDQTGLDPRDAVRADVDAYAVTLAARLQVAPASLARRLSTISSWYRYLLSNGCCAANPAAAVDRPAVDKDTSTTIGLTGVEVGRFMATARERCRRRDAALLGFMAELGLRVGEVVALDLESIRHNRGHRTVQVLGKGQKVRELPIPAPLGRDLDGWLADRGDKPGALFSTRSGRRVDTAAVFRLVRRVAGWAGLPAAEQLSPHSLRHTVATAALDAGAALRDVQDMLGHADPRTTRRYDRSRGSLDRSPAYLIAGLFAEDVVPGG
jgi:site-specific recombinase XerD